MSKNRFAPKKERVPECKQCHQPLKSAYDSEVGMCSVCFPPHGSPSCRTGFCSEKVELGKSA